MLDTHMKQKGASAMTERDIQNQMIDWINASKLAWCWENQTKATYDVKTKGFRRLSKRAISGVSDILGVMSDGRILTIEVKTKKTRNNASEKQKDFISKIGASGGVSFIAWELEQVIEKLHDELKLAQI